MIRLRQPHSGAVVQVDGDAAARYLERGYVEVTDDAPAEQPTVKQDDESGDGKGEQKPATRRSSRG